MPRNWFTAAVAEGRVVVVPMMRPASMEAVGLTARFSLGAARAVEVKRRADSAQEVMGAMIAKECGC